MGFLWFHTFDAAKFFKCLAVRDIAPHGINRIGRKNDHTSVLEYLNCLANFSWLWIVGMYGDDQCKVGLLINAINN